MRMKIFKNKNRAIKIQKAVLAFLVLSLVMPSVLLPLPHTAEALVPVWDVPNTPVHTLNSSQNFLNTTGKEFGLDTVAWLVAKMILRTITADVVSWINSGFNGSPAFVQDLGGFMADIADRTAGAFLEGSALSFMCDPFKLAINLSLRGGFFSFRDRVSCRLSDVVNNLQNFMSGDFLEGGFAGLMRMTMIPQNNMYGAYLLADQELSLRIAVAQYQAQKKLDWGSGFLTFETCEEQVGSPEEEAVEVCSPKTPGKIIEGQLQKVLGSGIDQLGLADEFNEIIGALMSQLLQQVFSAGKGLLGLGGASSPSSSFANRLRTDPINQERAPTPEKAGFVLPPPPVLGGPTTSFSYTISSPGIVSVRPGGIATIPITKTTISGTPVSVSLTAPTVPAVVTTTSFGNNPCTPTCISNLIITISTAAATGTHQVTVGGSPTPSNPSGTTDITIDVTDRTDITPPVVSVGTVTDAGILASAGVIVPVTATDDFAVAQVTVVEENDAITKTDASAPYDLQFDIPAGALVGTVLRFRVTATDTSGNVSSPITATYIVL